MIFNILRVVVVLCAVVACKRHDPMGERYQRGEIYDVLLDLQLDEMVREPVSLPQSAPQLAKSTAWATDRSVVGVASYCTRWGDYAARAGSVAGNQLENAVRDLNVFLVHTVLGQDNSPRRDIRFFYFDGLANPDGSPVESKFPIKLAKLYNGAYRVYAIANNNKSLYTYTSDEVSENFNRCSLTEEQICNLSTTSGKGFALNNGLLMSTVIDATEGAPTLYLRDAAPSAPINYTLTLRRRVAKIAFKYDVQLSDPNHTFVREYVTVNNAVGSITPFKEGTLPASVRKIEASSIEGSNYMFYVLENKRGNKTISNNTLRSSKYAPTKASYIFLDGKYITASLIEQTTGYQIYLGNGDVSNFDLESNTLYDYTSIVMGNSTLDTRVSTLTVNTKQTPSVDSKLVELKVSYANQFENSFKAYYYKNTQPNTFVDLKVEIDTGDGFKTMQPDEQMPICSSSLEQEQGVPVNFNISWGEKIGSGSILINIEDKYGRILPVIVMI